MVALQLRYPQDAPQRLEALLDYLNDWHQYQHEQQQQLIYFTMQRSLFRSELFILQRHFPQVDVQVVYLN